jgi:hypothetical protein
MAAVPKGCSSGNLEDCMKGNRTGRVNDTRSGDLGTYLGKKHPEQINLILSPIWKNYSPLLSWCRAFWKVVNLNCHDIRTLKRPLLPLTLMQLQNMTDLEKLRLGCEHGQTDTREAKHRTWGGTSSPRDVEVLRHVVAPAALHPRLGQRDLVAQILQALHQIGLQTAIQLLREADLGVGAQVVCLLRALEDEFEAGCGAGADHDAGVGMALVGASLHSTENMCQRLLL